MVSSLLPFQSGFSSTLSPLGSVSANRPGSLTGGLSGGLGVSSLAFGSLGSTSGGAFGASALATNPFGSSDPSAPLNNLLGGLPFSSPSPFAGSNASTPVNSILGSLPFSSTGPLTGSNTATPLNTLLAGLPNSSTGPLSGVNVANPLNTLMAGLPFSSTSPFAGTDPATPLNTLLSGLPNANTGPLTGVNAAAPLNNLLASLPFSAPTSSLGFVDPAGLLNMLAGTGISSAANPFTGGLQFPTAGSPLPMGGTTNIQPGQIQNNASLQQVISQIQQVPEAADLLQRALAKGYTIRIGDPSDGTEAPGVTTEGLTRTNGPNGNEIIISPNANDFIKTLVHETYHAATDGDGDSKTEEATANVIGDRVSAIINNRPPRDPQQIFAETFRLYPELPVNN